MFCTEREELSLSLSNFLHSLIFCVSFYGVNKVGYSSVTAHVKISHRAGSHIVPIIYNMHRIYVVRALCISGISIARTDWCDNVVRTYVTISTHVMSNKFTAQQQQQQQRRRRLYHSFRLLSKDVTATHARFQYEMLHPSSVTPFYAVFLQAALRVLSVRLSVCLSVRLSGTAETDRFY